MIHGTIQARSSFHVFVFPPPMLGTSIFFFWGGRNTEGKGKLELKFLSLFAGSYGGGASVTPHGNIIEMDANTEVKTVKRVLFFEETRFRRQQITLETILHVCSAKGRRNPKRKKKLFCFPYGKETLKLE